MSYELDKHKAFIYTLNSTQDTEQLQNLLVHYTPQFLIYEISRLLSSRTVQSYLEYKIQYTWILNAIKNDYPITDYPEYYI